MAFKWDESRLTAAMNVALGEKTKEDIAKDAGISRQTLYEWLDNDEFKSKVAEYLTAIEDAIKATGIGSRVQRLRRLNKRWEAIDSLINARGESAVMTDVPGGSTGLLCHEEKVVGGGENARFVDVFRADVALLKEERELAKQAAIEVGEWTEKQDVTSKGVALAGQVIITLPANGREAKATGGDGPND